MECIKWEQEGLLYTSGELTESEKTQYEQHVSQCVVCREELETYRTMKSTFFTPQNLSEPTTADLDTIVYRRCARKLHTTPFLFSTIVKKTVLSAFFLVLGFSATGYFVYLRNDATKSPVQTAGAGNNSETTPASDSDIVRLSALSDDSLALIADSVQRRPFAETLGNMSVRGVTTVDVKKE